MFCYIKEWPNKMATLMTVDGIVLCTCENTDEARKIWHDWKQQQSHAHAHIPDTSDAGLEVLRYVPTVTDRLRTVIASCV